MIAYLFPPIGGGGVQRITKFVKYLPAYGWIPYVLTSSSENKSRWATERDESLLSSIPLGTEITRIATFDQIFQRGGKLLHTILRGLAVPDDQTLTWAPRAIIKGLDICMKIHPSIIFTTSSPFSNHFVGFVLSKRLKIPWVADFRDAWTDNPHYRAASPIHKRIERKYEWSIYKSCSHIITTSKGHADWIAERFSGILRDKISHIYNGFDPDDFKDMTPSNKEKGVKVFISLGSSYEKYNADSFFKAMAMVLARNPELSKIIRIRFYGYKNNLPCNIFPILKNVVEINPYIAMTDVPRVLNEASYFVLYLPSDTKASHFWIPQRLFLYLRIGRPILAIVPEGETATLIRKHNAGIVVSPDDIDTLARHIERMTIENDCHLYGSVKNHLGYIQQYSRIFQTEQLANIFEKVIKEQP